MGITDELRAYAGNFYLFRYKDVREKLDAIADRIDAEYQKAIRELNNLSDASVLLPVDADGVLIHVGDMMERGKARGHVIALMLSECPKKWGGGLHWAIQLEGEQAPTALDSFFHHYHEPTVEDVLCELLNEYREGGCALEETRLSDYADKLRMVDENE